LDTERRVLVVEDNEADQLVVRHALGRARGRFHISFARRFAEAEELLTKSDFDAILLDLSLPDSDKDQTLPAMRDAAPHLPIIVVTGLADERYGLSALEHGAQDYLLKKDLIVEPMLERSLRYAIARHDAEVDLLKTREQLLKAQKMESIGRLAGGVAHDLNNILTAIFSFGQFVAEKLEPQSPAAEDMEEVMLAARRAERLTSQLLAFSRRRTVEPRIVDVNEVINDLERMLRRILGEHIDMRIRLDTEPTTVLIDPTAFEQVLMNLVVNARDAMPSGGVLTVETGSKTLSEADVLHRGGEGPVGKYAFLVVSDTGIGMSREVQEQIFDPFFSTKSGTEGTGLGLSTCYGIIKQAGGFTSVYSEVGTGTTFRVYLPQSEGEVSVLPTRVPVEDETGDETILVVEDDPLVRKSTVRVLRGLGYQVVDAASGKEALELVRTSDDTIDLLVTDVVMPEMNGKRLAWKLGRRLPTLKVLFMSGYTANVIVHHGILDSDVALMHKPFSPSDLAQRVREVLDTPAHFARRVGMSTVLLVTSDENLIDGCVHNLRGRTLVVARTRERALIAVSAEELDAVVIDPRLLDLSLDELRSHADMRDPALAVRTLHISNRDPTAIADELDRILGRTPGGIEGD
jgi:signal transduction histidine kinase